MSTSRLYLVAIAVLLGTGVLWWSLDHHVFTSPQAPQHNSATAPILASRSTPPGAVLSSQASDPTPRESAESPAQRIIEVISTDGRPIERADIFLTGSIGPTVRKADLQAIGETNSAGQLCVDAQTTRHHPSSFVAARASGYLPSFASLQAAGDDPIRLVLAPELRQRFRCVDLQGTPVPAVAVMLSRKGVPREFGADGLDTEEVSGFDPIDAILTGESDEMGIVEIGELRAGTYKLSIRSEYYDLVVAEGARSVVEISDGTHEIVLSPLLCGIIQVVGDEMYTHAVTSSADLWLPLSSGDRRNTFSLYRRLVARYPEALVYVTAHPNAHSTTTSVTAELWLARTGKRVVDLQLFPAYSDPKPTLIKVEGGTVAADTMSNVVFTIRDAAGRMIDCPHMRVYREKSVIPLMKEITPSQPIRLLYGRWQLATQYYVLESHFRPTFVDVSTPDAHFEIQLEIELVPVRVVAKGYRGQPENFGRLTFTQFGRSEKADARLDQAILWLRPGETEWSYSMRDFYEPMNRMIPVRAMPEGVVQTIEFELILKDGL